MNFETFRSHFPDVVDVVRNLKLNRCVTGSDCLRIVVVKDRSGPVKFIESLTGFAIELERNVLNPIEYHYICDPECEENEAFCTINDSLVELNMSTEYEELMDTVNELKDWGLVTSCYPIVLKIRSSCVADIQVVDFPLKTMELQFGQKWEEGQFEDEVIVRLDYNNPQKRYHETRDDRGHISMIKYSNDEPDKSCISSIRTLLVHSLVWEQLDGTRDIKRKRLVGMGDAIPETDDRKLRFISAVFSIYKSVLVNKMDFRKISQLITEDQSHKVIVEVVLKHYGSVFDQVAQETFCRFPLIVKEIQGISRTILTTVIRSELEKMTMNLVQTHFVLLHAFECDAGTCSGDCAFVCLVNALCSALVDKMLSTVTDQVQEKLSKFVPLLQEPPAITEERLQLKQQLKAMQKAFALLP